MSANKSKKIWGEDAEEWKPERWIERNGPTTEKDKDDDLFANSSPGTVAKEQLPGVYSGM